jgi:HPr kinase/phosphorylase
MMEPASSTALSIHASAVAIGEAGILIRGPSGCGKTSLARDLIFTAGLKPLFASLVGDDRVNVENCEGRLIARGHPKVRGLIEQRGLGILQIAHEPAVVARLVVDIVGANEAVRFPEANSKSVALCGVELPLLALMQGQAPYDCAVSVLTYLERAALI